MKARPLRRCIVIYYQSQLIPLRLPPHLGRTRDPRLAPQPIRRHPVRRHRRPHVAPGGSGTQDPDLLAQQGGVIRGQALRVRRVGRVVEIRQRHGGAVEHVRGGAHGVVEGAVQDGGGDGVGHAVRPQVVHVPGCGEVGDGRRGAGGDLVDEDVVHGGRHGLAGGAGVQEGDDEIACGAIGSFSTRRFCEMEGGFTERWIMGEMGRRTKGDEW